MFALGRTAFCWGEWARLAWSLKDNIMTPAWVLLCGFLVMAMQLGFALLEVGSVRHAHRMTVLVKNVPWWPDHDPDDEYDMSMFPSLPEHPF